MTWILIYFGVFTCLALWGMLKELKEGPCDE